MKMKFFNLARDIAHMGQHWQHKVSAVVVKGNRVLSTGFNKDKTHPASWHYFKSTHAEFDAIRKVPREQLKDTTIYVFRATKDGSPALSRPCPTCFEMIKAFGIKKICYTDNNSFKEEIVA